MIPEPNDPTRAGFAPPASGHVLLSRNEVETLCLKAARGAGLSWGIAEEAGFAAGWLCARQIDGPGALLARLEEAPGAAAPVAVAGGVLRGEGPLCPVATGAALSDFDTMFPEGISTGRVCRPLLLLPFVHQIAAARNRAMALGWCGGRVEIGVRGEVSGALAALAATAAAETRVAPAPDRPSPAPAKPASWPANAAKVGRLNAYAMLTTVPATAASRADAGAGAGDGD